MDTIESDSASSRKEMRCPDCWEIGLVRDDAFAEQEETEYEKIVNGTRCPNEDCDTGRIKPAEVERQYDSNGGGAFGKFDISSVFRKGVVGILAIMLIFALWVGLPLLTQESAIGGGQASSDTTQSGSESGGFSIEYTQNGPVITDGQKYITDSGAVSSTPYYYDSPRTARQIYSQVAPDGQQTSDTSGNEGNPNTGGSSDDSTSVAGTPQQESGSSDVQTSTESTGQPAANSSTLTEEELAGVTISAENNTDNFETENPNGDESAVIISRADGGAIAESATLSGTLLTEDYDPISGATVTIPAVGASIRTGADGEYLFDKIPPGEYIISADIGDDRTATRFAVTNSGKITIRGSPKNAIYTTRSDTDVVKDGRISLIQTDQYDISPTGTGEDMEVPLRFDNQQYADDVTVRLSPVKQPITASYTATTTDTADSGYLSTSVELPNTISTQQNISIASPPARKNISFNGTVTGSTENETQITVPGNIHPTGTTLRLNGSEATEDPTVKIDGETVVSFNGTLPDGYTTYIPDTVLSSGTQKVNFTTTSGSLTYNLSLTARARAVNGEVVVGSNKWELDDLGTPPIKPTHNATPTHEIRAGEVGENTLQLRTTPVSGITPPLQIRLNYNSGYQNSTTPKITVTDRNGTKHTKSPPHSSLNNGELTEAVTVSLPQSWFSSGTNTVRVRSENGTKVAAELTATGAATPAESFD